MLAGLLAVGKWLLFTKGGLALTAIAVGSTLAVQQRRSMQDEARRARKGAGAAQDRELQFQRELAGQGFELSKEQMQLQVKQRELQSLTDIIISQDTQPTVLTLPTLEPTSPIDRINMAIDDLLRGAA